LSYSPYRKHNTDFFSGKGTVMPSDDFDDDHVANLLKQDAKNAAKKYDLVGLEAFNPKRCVASLHYVDRGTVRYRT
jgi:hypothetical protein